jgi:poly-D-alanine transfer protein DltD
MGTLDYQMMTEAFLFLSMFDKWKTDKVIVVISPWMWFWNDK